ncbi:hypothetical protein D9M72_461450 [compost metagenome]
MIGESTHQGPLHFAGASLVTLGVQLVGAGEELPRVHGLQVRVELLLGPRYFFAFALLFSFGHGSGPCQLEGDALFLFLARQCRQIDFGANTSHVIPCTHRKLIALVASLFCRGAVRTVLTTVCSPKAEQDSFESRAIGAYVVSLQEAGVGPRARHR